MIARRSGSPSAARRTRANDVLIVDGSLGEGGGQVLRTALALSVHTRTPIRVVDIRAGRAKPGLLRQHRCAVQAAAAISDAEVTGDVLGSTEIAFTPRELRPGGYTFDVGSAGSASLVLQTILPPLMLASAPSRLKIDGGTHNKASPPFPFLAGAFAPLLGRMGPSLTVDLPRWGFYPAGGGRIVADIDPVASLAPLHLDERGTVESIAITAAVSALPTSIAHRELTAACLALGRPRGEGRIVDVPEPRGPGNALWIAIASEHVTEVFTGFGDKGVRAEAVAGSAAEEARAYLDADVPVGEHLADQLLIPLALAGSGSFRTTSPSLHLTTNIEVIRRFLDVAIAIAPDRPGSWRISIGDAR